MYSTLRTKSDIFLNKILPNKKINPIILTSLSILFKLTTLALLFKGHLIIAFITLILEIILDISDGFYARKNKSLSKMGGFLDHISDFTLRPLYLLPLIYFNHLSQTIVLIFLISYFFSTIIDLSAENYKLKLKHFIFTSLGPSFILLIGIPFKILPTTAGIAISFNLFIIAWKLISISRRN